MLITQACLRDMLMTDPEFILGLEDLIIYLDSSEYKTRVAMEQDLIRIKLLLDSCHQTQRCHNVTTITTKCYLWVGGIVCLREEGRYPNLGQKNLIHVTNNGYRIPVKC